jgi:hypothetical protein
MPKASLESNFRDRFKKKDSYMRFLCYWAIHIPTDGVSTLSWWWGLSAPETLRVMPAVA